MAANTAVGARNKDTRTITFKNNEHKKFYKEYLQKCRYQDEYHKALVYCLGIDQDTRVNVGRIYDFKTGCVKPECLHEGWQTSGRARIVRMAFNLYCNGTPSVYDTEDVEETIKGVPLLYGGRFILLRLCQIFLGGCEAPLSGILFLRGLGGFIY